MQMQGQGKRRRQRKDGGSSPVTLSTPASIAASTTSSPYEAMTAVATVSSKFCAVGEGGVRQYAFIFQAPADPVQQALSAVCSRVNAYFAVLENVRRQQKVVMNSAPESGADGGPLMLLSRQQDELHSAARCDFHVLRCLYDEVLLPPLEICYLVALSEGLECVLRQLDVYQAELVQRLPGGIPVDGTGAGAGASFASLAAAAYSQPAALLCTQSSFRRSNMRGQGMQFVVELLSPAAGSVSVLGDVRIDLLAYSSDGYTLDAFSSDVKRRNSISPTDSLSSSTSASSTGSSPTAFTPTVPEPYSEFGESNTAYFLFRCPTGSNKRPVGVAFSVPVRIESPQGHVHEQSLELYYPRPSIIVTNSIQWMDAEGVLLRNEIFADRTEVSWTRLCNALQGWLLDATRQPHLKAARILTKKDFAYLRQKAGLRSVNVDGNEGESEEQLFPVERWEAFWGFFGACAEKVRHQKSIMPMWCRGLVYGMGAKAECAALLAGHEPGTFMIRFSDTCPGTFAVAFVGEDGGGAIHHALIRDTDASGAKRGVLEFIHDVAEVRQILVVQRDWEGNDVTPRSMRLVPKEAVLQEFFTYKPPKPTPGYEEVAIPPRAFGVSRPLAPTAYSQPTRCVLSTNTKLTN